MSTTKKAPAKATTKAVATTKRAPAKAAPAAKAPQMFMASATGRGGETNIRKVPFEAKFGVDVADPDARKAALQKGQIWRFFSSKEKAEAWAAKRTEEGLDAVVVPATAKAVA